mmetsp:Transcript_12134/g.25046  ORF Transcript_12134/g.25046 Transcript_12134/m.25046 type:complete len:209 (+) Transcript_12134:303-929(+)
MQERIERHVTTMGGGTTKGSTPTAGDKRSVPEKETRLEKPTSSNIFWLAYETSAPPSEAPHNTNRRFLGSSSERTRFCAMSTSRACAQKTLTCRTHRLQLLPIKPREPSDNPCPSNSRTAILHFREAHILTRFCTVHVSADSQTPGTNNRILGQEGSPKNSTFKRVEPCSSQKAKGARAFASMYISASPLSFPKLLPLGRGVENARLS